MAYVASRMTPRHFRMLAYVALLGSVFLLVLTYVPGLGVGVNGNTNWLNLGGPLQIQPSEFAKLALVMWCADLYARKQKLLTQWKHLLVPMVPVCGLVIALIVGQHDLGTALVLMAVMIGMIWVVGAPTRLFVATIVVVGTIAVVLRHHRAAPDGPAARTSSNPFADPTGIGWQAYHSFYALSTGGWWGVGIGNSRQKWGNLPEAHTDFIFSVIGEELGLIGSLTVLALFLTLAYAGVRIATRNTEPFVRYAAAGITVWIMAQTLVNLGAVIGLLPIVGIPLPLLSYGGSALLPTLIAIGMLLSFAKAEPGAQAALKETRRPRFGWLSSRRTAEREHAGALKAVPSIVLAGGGSAGHTFPLIATADALRRIDPTVEILALGTERGLETRVVPEAGYRLELIPPVPLPRKPTPALFAVPGKMLTSVSAARKVLDEAKADVLVGFGGYVSTPAYVAAWRRKTPIVVHEGNAVPGIANKFAARYCTQHVDHLVPRHGPAARPVRRAADPPGHLPTGPGRAAGRGPAVLRAGPGRADAVRDGWFAGRPAAERGVRRCRCGPAGGRHPGAARDRPEEHARGRADRPLPVRRAVVRRPDGSTPTPPPTWWSAGRGRTPSPRCPASACPRSTFRCRSVTVSND